MVVGSHVDILADGDGHDVSALCFHNVSRLVHCHPARQVLNSISMCCTTLVLDMQIYLVLLTFQHGLIDALANPRHRIAVHIETLRLWRRHEVTILVGDISYRYVDVTFVDALILLVNIDQQLVVTTHETEVQVAQLLISLYGSTNIEVNELSNDIFLFNEDVVVLVTDFTVIIVFHLLVQHVRLQHEVTILLTLLSVEVEIDFQALL